MKIKYYIVLTAVLLTGLISCKKYTEITPKGAFVPTATSDFRLLLDETYLRGKSVGFFSTYSNDILVDDDMVLNGFSITFLNADQLSANHYQENIYLDSETDPDWEGMYNQIYTCNLVITEVMASTGGTDAQKQQLMAEARVHRAFAYFSLVNLYGRQYNPATASSDLGVPIREGLDFTEKLPRKSVNEVYNYLINDLKLAVPYLSASPDPAARNRPVKPTAYTLISRASLFKNDLVTAYAYADSSIKNYGTLLDFNSLPPNPAFLAALAYPINFQNPETLVEKTTNSGVSVFYAAPALLSAYDNPKDLRLSGFFIQDINLGLSFGSLSLEWFGKQPAKGPSVPESYLLRAESSARLGNYANAMADVNTLRSFRFPKGSNYTLTAATSAQALAIVKAERRRELAFRGFRYFDIKRYNVYDNDNISVSHTDNTGTYTLAPNSNRVVLPIAREYIALNPEITQNPR